MTLTAPARLSAALLVAALASPAFAQPGATPPPAREMPAEKSPALAFGLSFLGTSAGVAALVAAGRVDHGEYYGTAGLATLVVAPSLGHLYAGESGRALRHAGVRAGALAVMGIGIATVLSSPCAFGSENECPETREAVGLGIFVGGAALGAASVVYSIVDAPRAAARTNREAASIVLVPAPIIGPDRSPGLGLALAGSL